MISDFTNILTNKVWSYETWSLRFLNAFGVLGIQSECLEHFVISAISASKSPGLYVSGRQHKEMDVPCDLLKQREDVGVKVESFRESSREDFPAFVV